MGKHTSEHRSVFVVAFKDLKDEIEVFRLTRLGQARVHFTLSIL